MTGDTLRGSRRRLLQAALAAPLTASLAGRAGAALAGPETDDVQALLAEQVDPGRQSVGYVAALIGGDGAARIVAAGRSGAPDGRPLDGGTLFEIGSVTKVFTALLLADMAVRGEVAMDDPVAKLLPTQGRPRAFDGKQISLLDLATHTSGLPRLPDGMHPADSSDPYSDYTEAQLYAFLSGFEPKQAPVSHYQYSNLGFGLLGHALALRAGRSFEDLVVSRVCGPLGLDGTRITLSPALLDRLAQGHDTALNPAGTWNMGVLAGAGGLRSCGDDLARFLGAAQGRLRTPLAAAFARLLEVRRPCDEPNTTVAAGWFVRAGHDDELAIATGGTGGYSSSAGYSLRSGHAAALLSNAAAYETTEMLGRHLVDSGFPPPAVRQEVLIDPAKLRGYAGRYAISQSFTITVAVRNGALIAQATGQSPLQLFAEDNTRFFFRAVNAQITFEPGPDGKAAALVLHQNGRDVRAERTP